MSRDNEERKIKCTEIIDRWSWLMGLLILQYWYCKILQHRNTLAFFIMLNNQTWNSIAIVLDFALLLKELWLLYRSQTYDVAESYEPEFIEGYFIL